MKILHLIFSMEVGGAETMLVDIINQQVLNHEVCLYVINDQYNQHVLNKISNKCNIILQNRKVGSRHIKDIIKLNKFVLSFCPTIIHCHDSNIINYILVRFFFHTILTVHDTKLSLVGAKKYRDIIAISKAVGDDLRTRGITKYQIVYNGVKANTISTKIVFKTINHSFRIVQVGRLEHLKKGQHLTLESIHLLKKRFPNIDIKIDFIGIGSSLDYLKNKITQLGIELNVCFLGLKDREYIYSHLKDYDLLVQPSINEGFGLTVIEGMIAGLPVLVSDVEGPMEVIQNGKYGFTFYCNDATDMAKQIGYIINNTEMRSAIAMKGKEYATAHFDISYLIKQYEVIYKGKS